MTQSVGESLARARRSLFNVICNRPEPRIPGRVDRSRLARELDMTEEMIDDLVQREILPRPFKGKWSWKGVLDRLEQLPQWLNCVAYVIGFGDYVKIGFTSGPLHSRLAVLQTGSPEKLEVIAKIDGTPRDERRLEHRFARFCTHGEWFRREGELAVWIDAGGPIEEA